MTSLFKNIIIISISLIILILLAGNVYQAFKIHNLNNDNKTLETSVSTLTENLKNCNSSVQLQNQKIADAAKQTADYQQQLSALQPKLDDQLKQNKELLDKLEKVPAPKTCQESIEYLKNNLELYK